MWKVVLPPSPFCTVIPQSNVEHIYWKYRLNGAQTIEILHKNGATNSICHAAYTPNLRIDLIGFVMFFGSQNQPENKTGAFGTHDQRNGAWFRST